MGCQFRVLTVTRDLPSLNYKHRMTVTPTAGFNYRILVVDDDPSVLQTSVLVLENKGYEVRAAQECSGSYRCFVSASARVYLLALLKD